MLRLLNRVKRNCEFSAIEGHQANIGMGLIESRRELRKERALVCEHQAHLLNSSKTMAIRLPKLIVLFQPGVDFIHQRSCGHERLQRSTVYHSGLNSKKLLESLLNAHVLLSGVRDAVQPLGQQIEAKGQRSQFVVL